MPTLPLFQVDAFTSQVFSGNPAAVVVLDDWLPEETLLSIAAENNLSETAFVRLGEGRHELRWFTTQVEVDLCGHATLAAAHVLFSHDYVGGDSIEFRTGTDTLGVNKVGDRLALDFPSRAAVRADGLDEVARAVGRRPQEVHSARDWMAVFASQEEVESLEPDFSRVADLPGFALIATAPGRDCDFVSRFFAPAAGVPEDPVTGSAHCTLIPYWSERLEKRTLHARQVSARGGELFCEDRGDRVVIAGSCCEYLVGQIQIP